MKVVNNNATAALFAKAEELNVKPKEGWKCIYFKIPDAQERQVHSLYRFDESIITHMLERLNGFAYLCDNGEMFILYRGTYNYLTTRLSMYLWALHSKQADDSQSNHHLYSHFDLSSQWQGFYRFCERRHMEALADYESSASRSSTPIPVELLQGSHVAGYLTGQ